MSGEEMTRLTFSGKAMVPTALSMANLPSRRENENSLKLRVREADGFPFFICETD